MPCPITDGSAWSTCRLVEPPDHGPHVTLAVAYGYGLLTECAGCRLLKLEARYETPPDVREPAYQ